MIVNFLKKDFSIPEDVLTYIDLLNFTDNVQKQLFGVFVCKLKNEIAKDNIGLLGDEDLAAEMEQQIGKFVAKLCDNGIFTRTVSAATTEHRCASNKAVPVRVPGCELRRQSSCFKLKRNLLKQHQ